MNPAGKTDLNGQPLDALWNAKRVREYLSVSERWLRKSMSTGVFPAPDFRLSGRCSMRWRRESVEAFLESKAANNGVPKGCT